MTLPSRRQGRPRGHARLALAGDFPDGDHDIIQALSRTPDWDGSGWQDAAGHWHGPAAPGPADALARDEAAVALARETLALLAGVGDLIGAEAERADDVLAGGGAPKPAAHNLITACRMIAAATRGKTATT